MFQARSDNCFCDCRLETFYGLPCDTEAVNIDAPTYAHEILTTTELIAAIKATPAAATA